MARDAADYCADSRSCYGSGDFARTRAVFTFAGIADTEAGASANQRAQRGAANSAPSQLALLRTSA
jgi:hypothetical protein